MKTFMGQMKLALLFLVVNVIFSSIGFAATYYVAPHGSDSNNGSAEHPWKSIGISSGKMSSGDTLIIKDGIYRGIENMIDYHTANHPPNGTAGSWTKIEAENYGNVFIDGELTYMPVHMHNTRYLWFDGLIARGAEGTFWFEGTPNSSNYHHVKVTRCGSIDSNNYLPADPTEGRAFPYYVNGVQYVLFEDCWASGGGNYYFLFLNTDYCIARRCVVRIDRCASDYSLISPFRFYGSQNCQFQNCILVDSDDSTYYFEGNMLTTATPYFTWFGSNTSYGPPDYTGECSSNTYVGCIAVNSPKVNAGVLGTQDDALFNGNNHIKDTVFSNLKTGFVNQAVAYWGVIPVVSSHTVFFENCLFTDIRNGYALSAMAGYANRNDSFSIVFASNCIFNNCADGVRNVVSDYNLFWNIHSGNNFSIKPAGLHDYCSENANAVNPLYSSGNSSGGLKYPLRVETGSNLSAKGTGGRSIGPEIIYQIGTPGSLWGESGFDTVTTTPLWPYPYELVISSYMRQYTYQAYGLPAISGNRGFCAGKSVDGSKQTLTKYIWESLGNLIPAEYAYDTSVLEMLYSDTTARAGEMRIVGPTSNRGVVNPNRGESALIVFKGYDNGKYNCRIFDLNRNQIWEDSMQNVDKGIFTWAPPTHTPSGGYIVNVRGPNFNQTKKVAVIK